MLARRGAECFVCALQDALRADVDPTAGGHLAVHGEAHRFEAAKLFPIGPFGYEHRIGNEDARGGFVRANHADGAAALNQESLVVFKMAQGADDSVEVGPASRGLACAAVDDEAVGVFGDVGVEIVVQHSHGGFLMPALA